MFFIFSNLVQNFNNNVPLLRNGSKIKKMLFSQKIFKFFKNYLYFQKIIHNFEKGSWFIKYSLFPKRKFRFEVSKIISDLSSLIVPNDACRLYVTKSHQFIGPLRSTGSHVMHTCSALGTIGPAKLARLLFSVLKRF